jgi:hypothetical protein
MDGTSSTHDDNTRTLQEQATQKTDAVGMVMSRRILGKECLSIRSVFMWHNVGIL